MFNQAFRRRLPLLMVVSILVPAAGSAARVKAQGPPLEPPPINFKVEKANQQIEMTVNTSRIITLEQKIPQAQVNNPDVLELTVLSPNEIQLSAKAPGVTQVNLWGEDQRLYTVNVIVYGDSQELAMLLRTLFPNASLKVIPVASGVLISGFVDQPRHVDLIVRTAEEYYPKVINNMTVSGVQQVLLHVKVMEVSRTKLRRLGFDFAKITGNNLVVSGISGLISGASGAGVATSGDETFAFNVFTSGSSFFGILEALRQDNLMKILAEPTLVTVSGRPAYFQVGGEFPILVPQSLGTVSIEFKKFGTQVDFVPIVLGNGRIRLEVRPRVSEIDNSRSVTIGSTTVPGLRTREVDTGVEMQAGQTLAIAGLVQTRVEAENRGLPWISEVPYLGIPFRKVHEQANEIELLILVTPELVEAMDVHEVPPCGPGMRTTSPNDCELFLKGHLEVPNCCPDCGGAGCADCIQGGAGPSPTVIPQGGMILEGDDELQTPPPAGAAAPRPRPARPVSAPLPAGPTRTGRQWSNVLRQPAAQTRPAAVDKPAASQNRYTPSKPQPAEAVSRPGKQATQPGFIGPIGYDVVH